MPAPAGAGEQLVCNSSPQHITKLRAFYTFSVDLGDYEDVTKESIEALQELRASGGLLALYEAGLSGVPDFESQSDRIVDAAKDAVNRDGKAVWSDTFIQTRASWLTPYPQSFDMGAEQLRIKGQMSRIDGTLSGWEFDTIRGYLTPDGVVVLTVSFRQDGSCGFDQAIQDLRTIRRFARKMFDQHATWLVNNGSPVRKLLVDREFTPGSHPNSEKVRSHRTVFVHSFKCASGRICDAHRVRNTAAVAGLMNLASWFPDYHGEYRQRLASKEFGYRSSEMYLVDRDTTLCVQQGFWEAGDPLSLYMGNVLQAIEYHLGLQALLRGQLQYARQLYSTSTSQDSTLDAVEGVRRSRAILSGAYESLNYSVLVLHGFTRRLLRALDEESEISAILEDVERRVENVSDSVSLQASVATSLMSAGLQNFGNGINRKVLWATLVGAVAGVLALVVTLSAWLQTTDSKAGGAGTPSPTSPVSSNSSLVSGP